MLFYTQRDACFQRIAVFWRNFWVWCKTICSAKSGKNVIFGTLTLFKSKGLYCVEKLVILWGTDVCFWLAEKYFCRSLSVFSQQILNPNSNHCYPTHLIHFLGHILRKSLEASVLYGRLFGPFYLVCIFRSSQASYCTDDVSGFLVRVCKNMDVG